jgi:hypothetical protein
MAGPCADRHRTRPRASGSTGEALRRDRRAEALLPVALAAADVCSAAGSGRAPLGRGAAHAQQRRPAVFGGYANSCHGAHLAQELLAGGADLARGFDSNAQRVAVGDPVAPDVPTRQRSGQRPSHRVHDLGQQVRAGLCTCTGQGSGLCYSARAVHVEHALRGSLGCAPSLLEHDVDLLLSAHNDDEVHAEACGSSTSLRVLVYLLDPPAVWGHGARRGEARRGECSGCMRGHLGHLSLPFPAHLSVPFCSL